MKIIKFFSDPRTTLEIVMAIVLISLVVMLASLLHEVTTVNLFIVGMLTFAVIVWVVDIINKPKIYRMIGTSVTFTDVDDCTKGNYGIHLPPGTIVQVINYEIDNSFDTGVKVKVRFPNKEAKPDWIDSGLIGMIE